MNTDESKSTYFLMSLLDLILIYSSIDLDNPDEGHFYNKNIAFWFV